METETNEIWLQRCIKDGKLKLDPLTLERAVITMDLIESIEGSSKFSARSKLYFLHKEKVLFGCEKCDSYFNFSISKGSLWANFGKSFDDTAFKCNDATEEDFNKFLEFVKGFFERK